MSKTDKDNFAKTMDTRFDELNNEQQERTRVTNSKE